MLFRYVLRNLLTRREVVFPAILAIMASVGVTTAMLGLIEGLRRAIYESGPAENAIVLEGDDETPMPWANVIANPGFGTIVTASGSATTWSANSRENRLTPFANDPTADPFFLFDGSALLLQSSGT